VLIGVSATPSPRAWRGTCYSCGQPLSFPGGMSPCAVTTVARAVAGLEDCRLTARRFTADRHPVTGLSASAGNGVTELSLEATQSRTPAARSGAQPGRCAPLVPRRRRDSRPCSLAAGDGHARGVAIRTLRRPHHQFLSTSKATGQLSIPDPAHVFDGVGRQLPRAGPAVTACSLGGLVDRLDPGWACAAGRQIVDFAAIDR